MLYYYSNSDAPDSSAIAVEESDWWLSGGISAANAIAVYQPKGAASLAASYVNLANPGTYDAAPGVAPTFNTATGWTFNGSTQYLDTGLIPSSLNWSAFVRFSGAANDGTVLGSLSSDTTRFQCSVASISGQRLYGNGNLLTVSSVSETEGVIGFSGLNAYFDGSSDGTIGGGGGPTGRQLAVGAIRVSTITAFFAGNIQAVTIYDTTLNAAQVAAVSAAMAAL